MDVSNFYWLKHCWQFATINYKYNIFKWCFRNFQHVQKFLALFGNFCNWKHLLNVCSLDIRWFNLTTPNLFLSLILSKFIMNFFSVRNLYFTFCNSGLKNFFTRSTNNVIFEALCGKVVVLETNRNLTCSSSCSKVVSCKTLDFNQTEQNHGDLLENLKENIITKVNFLKLLKEENFNWCFYKFTAYWKQRPPLTIPRLVEISFLIIVDILSWNEITLKKYVKKKLCPKDDFHF